MPNLGLAQRAPRLTRSHLQQSIKVVGSVVRKATELLRIEVEPNRPADIEALALTGERDPTSPRAFGVTV